MSAVEHLVQYNVSVDQARGFLLSNLENLGYIIEVCGRFGVTNQMIAEIIGSGLTTAQVTGYFAERGIDSTVLDSSSANSPASLVGTWLASAEESTTRVTFYEDGTYRTEDSVAVTMEGERNGNEAGTYSWDETTGRLTINTLYDNNGSLGFNSNPSISITSGYNANQIIMDDGELKTFTKQTDASVPPSPTELAFTYEELQSQVIYNVYQDEGDPWEIISFKFLADGTMNAEHGITENPNQYQNIPYEITEQGHLKFYYNWEGEISLDVIAKLTDDSSPYDYSMLSWISIENPSAGFDEPIPEWLNSEHLYNQYQGSDIDNTGEYFFYNANDAMLFIS